MGRKRKLPEGMVTRAGRRGYYADFRIGGRRIQKQLGTDFEAARSILNELKARAEKSDWGLLDNNYPIKELQDAFLKRCSQELRASSSVRYRMSLNKVLTWLNVSKVNQLDVVQVMKYREWRLASAGPATVNHDLTILGAMLRWGVEKKLIGSNPLDGIKKLPNDNPRDGRPLTDDEVARLLKTSGQPWRDIWYAYLVTGMRRSELAELRFSDIDWGNRELIVRTYRAKSHRERRIPIEDGLWKILKRQAAEASGRKIPDKVPKIAQATVQKRFTKDHVFVTRMNTPLDHDNAIYGPFRKCCTRAGIEMQTHDGENRLVEHVDVHSLRRTFTTNAIVNGADPKSVQEILGHKTLDMTMKIYAKVKAAPKRQTVARLSYAQGATPPEHVLPLASGQG